MESTERRKGKHQKTNTNFGTFSTCVASEPSTPNWPLSAVEREGDVLHAHR